jgi:hypothetical protein
MGNLKSHFYKTMGPGEYTHAEMIDYPIIRTTIRGESDISDDAFEIRSRSLWSTAQRKT